MALGELQAIADFPESLRNLRQLEVIRGNLRRDASAFGISQEVKAKLKGWLPKARLEIG